MLCNGCRTGCRMAGYQNCGWKGQSKVKALKTSALAAALVSGAAVGWFASGAMHPDGPDIGRTDISPSHHELRTTGPSADRPKRRALIRSSADPAIQEKILRKRVAMLEKRLASAKREAEAIASSDGAKPSPDTMSHASLQKQIKAALETLFGKPLKDITEKDQANITVGEIRKLAPEWVMWWKANYIDCQRRIFGDRLLNVLQVFASVDLSQMSQGELDVHEKCITGLAAAKDAYESRFVEISDETTLLEFILRSPDITERGKAYRKVRDDVARYLDMETRSLSDMVKRYYGLSGEAAAVFEKTISKDNVSMMRNIVGGYGKSPMSDDVSSGQRGMR